MHADEWSRIVLSLKKLLKRPHVPPDDPLLLVQRFGGTIRGIVHIGANDGEECGRYVESGASSVVYVEPLPEPFARLERKTAGIPGHVPVQALLADTEGKTVDFHVASNRGQSSSLFGLGRHGELYPEIGYTETRTMTTTTLDTLLATDRFKTEPFDLLVMDVQGAELLVLRGAERTLAKSSFLSLEVSESPLYDGSCCLDDVIAHLTPRRFRLRHLDMNPLAWGHAFFMRI
jgi:FkbM family methyltransferase